MQTMAQHESKRVKEYGQQCERINAQYLAGKINRAEWKKQVDEAFEACINKSPTQYLLAKAGFEPGQVGNLKGYLRAGVMIVTLTGERPLRTDTPVAAINTINNMTQFYCEADTLSELLKKIGA